MPDHIPTRELSALLDRDPGEASASDHLEECGACRRELELLRRMRMALSAMDEPHPPAGQWDRIRGRLDERGRLRAGDTAGTRPEGGADGRDGPAAPDGWASRRGAEEGGEGPEPGGQGGVAPAGIPGWLRVAAGVLLFAGGVGLGVSMNASSPDSETARATDSPPPARTAQASRGAASGPAAGAAGAADGSTARGASTYRAALDQLEALRSEGLSPEEAFRDPEAAAERLARLDALIRASRDALADDPADPAVNDFLFQVVEERQALNQALHLSSLEYR